MPELIVMAIALFLTWLLGTAAVHKLRNGRHYRQLMGTYLNRGPVGQWMVWLVASVELGLAIALVAPESQRVALAGASILLTAYVGLMGLQLALGRADMKCGCAGPASETTISPSLILRNLVCVALALVAMLPTVPVYAGIVGIGLALFVASFAALAYLGSEQLIANAQQMAGER